MPIDRIGDPSPDGSYNGFSGGPPRRPAPPTRRSSTRALVIGGVAAALALGVLSGFLARPELIGSRPQATEPPTDLAPPGAAQLPIAVSPPPAPQPLPGAPGRLETLPPEMAAATRPRSASDDAAASAPSPEIDVIDAPDADAAAPVPRHRASFDCATARPGAEEMVCSDAALAAADRRLARAWRRAEAAPGVPLPDLRREQRDWAAIREDAARHSPEALADVYDQRIRELNEIAASGSGDYGAE